ncbi:MAG TPA: antibiotic biosynthesis monooxygenase [Ilumatobacter sp.]|nr:antibiotic biosynthesis monooxygenase [Ilumatobacter sp.]
MSVRLVRWLGVRSEGIAATWREAEWSGRQESVVARSVDDPGRLVLVERWAAADDLTAAIHDHGSELFPSSEVGDPPRDGIELYRHATFERHGTEWVDTTYTNHQLTVTAGDRGPIRVIVSCRREHPSTSASVASEVAETRTEPGCQQFGYFVDVQDPRSVMLFELWGTPADYDRHWIVRLQTEAWRGARNDLAWGAVEVASAEFYPHRQLRRYYDRLLPVDQEWASTVRWGL